MPGTLIIQTAFLGDVILTTPLIQAASLKFRPDPVCALVIPSGAQALGHPDALIEGLDEIIVYDKRGKDKGFGAFLDFVKRLKEHKFDRALVPHRSARSAALAYLADIPVRVAFDQNAFGLLFTHRVKRNVKKHEVERNLDLLEPFGGAPENFVPELKVSYGKQAGEKAEALLEGLTGKTPLVGIAPGSVWGTKRWPPERFAAVADALHEQIGAAIVLVGGPADAESATAVVSNAKSPILNLVGKTTIQEMIAVVGRMNLFVGNDSGPMHVAVATKTPAAVVFGATTPALGFSPYTKNALVIEAGASVDCRPCGAHGPKDCPKKHFRCMMEVEPESVVAAARELLGRR